jgi:hypothetical protein
MSDEWGRSIMKCLKGLVTFSLVLFSVPTLAEPSARELLDKARDFVASAPAIQRVDTTEQSTVAIISEVRIEPKPQTRILTIEIDRPKELVRQTTLSEGRETVILKQGENAAMKRGKGPWIIPTGLHAQIAKDMGNLGVCEIEVPETKQNAPNWKLVGMELLDGDEAFVIESEGNTLVPLAQERIAKGLAKAFSGDPAEQPRVKVLEYSAKHWISTSDYRPLQAVQISKVEASLAPIGGVQRVTEQSTKATSRYRYDKVTIEIPEDAQKILSDNNPPLQTAEPTDEVPAVHPN